MKENKNNDEIVLENGEYFKIVKDELPFSTENLSQSEINQKKIQSLATWKYYYYKAFGLYVKTKKFSGKFYYLNPVQKVWVQDDEFYDEFMRGELHLTEIEFNDIYDTADESVLKNKRR